MCGTCRSRCIAVSNRRHLRGKCINGMETKFGVDGLPSSTMIFYNWTRSLVARNILQIGLLLLFCTLTRGGPSCGYVCPLEDVRLALTARHVLLTCCNSWTSTLLSPPDSHPQLSRTVESCSAHTLMKHPKISSAYTTKCASLDLPHGDEASAHSYGIKNTGVIIIAHNEIDGTNLCPSQAVVDSSCATSSGGGSTYNPPIGSIPSNTTSGEQTSSTAATSGTTTSSSTQSSTAPVPTPNGAS